MYLKFMNLNLLRDLNKIHPSIVGKENQMLDIFLKITKNFQVTTRQLEFDNDISQGLSILNVILEKTFAPL